MKRIILVSLVVVTLVTPQIVSAAWWNPFSWNWKALFSFPSATKTEVQNTDLVEQDETPITPKEDNEPDKKAVSPTFSVPSVVPKVDSQTPVVTPVIFQIQNVKNYVTKERVTVSWTTTLAAQSRLVIEGETIKGYESMNGVGTQHEIKIDNPTPSTEYFYKIVAITNDGKITEFYNSFTAVRKFNAVFDHKNGCPIIRVEDSLGKPGRDVKIVISGTYGETVPISLPRITKITNEEGEAQLPVDCDRKLKKLKIVGDDFETNLEINDGGDVQEWPTNSSA